MAPHFDKIADESEPPSYWDSIPYLGLLFPFNSHLGLERFIVGFGLADKESHRGLEDALDLLKVLLVATSLVKRDREWADFLSDNFKRHNLQEWWYARFFQQSERGSWKTWAEAIELDLAGSLERGPGVAGMSGVFLRMPTMEAAKGDFLSNSTPMTLGQMYRFERESSEHFFPAIAIANLRRTCPCESARPLKTMSTP